jgi:hypothetical protein
MKAKEWRESGERGENFDLIRIIRWKLRLHISAHLLRHGFVRRGSGGNDGLNWCSWLAPTLRRRRCCYPHSKADSGHLVEWSYVLQTLFDTPTASALLCIRQGSQDRAQERSEEKHNNHSRSRSLQSSRSCCMWTLLPHPESRVWEAWHGWIRYSKDTC